MKKGIEERCELLRRTGAFSGYTGDGEDEEGDEWGADAKDVDWGSRYLNFCAKTTPAGFTHPVGPPPVYQDHRIMVVQGSHLDAVTALGSITGRELNSSYLCVVKHILKTGECPDEVGNFLEHELGSLPNTPEADEVRRAVILFALHEFSELREMFACGYVVSPDVSDAWRDKINAIKSRHEKRSTIQLMYDSTVKKVFPFTTRYQAIDHEDMETFFRECTKQIHDNFLVDAMDNPAQYVDEIMSLLAPQEDVGEFSMERMKGDERGGEDKKEGVEGYLLRHRHGL